MKKKEELIAFLTGPHDFPLGDGANHFLGPDAPLQRWGKEVCARAMVAVVDHTLQALTRHAVIVRPEALALHALCESVVLNGFSGAAEIRDSELRLELERYLDFEGSHPATNPVTWIAWSESYALHAACSFDDFVERAYVCVERATSRLLLGNPYEIPEECLRRLGRGDTLLTAEHVERGQLAIIPLELLPWIEGTGDALRDRVTRRGGAT